MRRFIVCLLSATFLSGAAFAAEEQDLTTPPEIDVPLAELAPPAPKNPAPAESPSTASLPLGGRVVTMDVAIRRALDASPRLKSAEAAEAASVGTRSQAGAWTNPELSLQSEQLGGSGAYTGTRSAQTFAGVTQLVEIGGKRSARRDVADQGIALAGFDRQQAKLDLVRDVELAYADAVAAQERVTLAESQQSLAQETYDTVRKRVGAAREPLIQQSKAEVLLASATIAVEQAKQQLIAAKKALAILWKGDQDFVLDGADFFAITPPPPVDTSVAWKANPDIARLDAEIARNKASLDLEQANAVPDPRITAGVQDFRDSKDQAFLVGISIPIPVLNRNQGNIERARQDVVRSEFVQQTAKLAASAELTKAQTELETAYRQAIALKETILPAAKKAFALSRQGYGAGRFPYLEVLDAQRTLNDTRAQYQDTLLSYHRARAQVERLIAKPTALLTSNESNEAHHEE